MIALLGAQFLPVMLSILFIIVCLLLIFMVVITPSSEGGMAAAFGGMGSDSFFGTKAHQHINKFTVFLAVSFLVLAFCINWTNKEPAPAEGGKGKSAIEEKMKGLPAQPKSGQDLPPIAPPNK